MKKEKVCYLCGEIATTRDHIPPKSLFPKDFQQKGITVPACVRCNNQASKDDEYLRDVFAMTSTTKEARKVFEEGVRPSYTRPYALLQKVTKHQRILNSMEKVDLRTPGGVFLKQVTGMRMKADRVESVLKRITRGVYYHTYKKRIPYNYTLKVYYDPVDIGTGILDEARKKGALNVQRFGDVFLYMGVAVKEEEFVSVWWLSFYKTHQAIVLVDSPKKIFG